MTSATVERRRGLTADKGMKAPVTVAATGALTLSGEQTIDGYAVKASNAAGRPDRVLALFQAAAVDNGIWDVATGAWTRSLDADDNTDLTKGTLIPVASGNQAGQFFRLTTADPIQPGTTAMSFAVALAAQIAPVIATIAAVRALDKTQNSRAFVTGYYAAGDSGGGAYYYDATDTTSADNGGSTIVATDGGRWKLVIQGQVNAGQFGAKFDNVTDDTAAWNAASLALSLAGGGVLLGKIGATSYIAGTNGLLLPSGIELDLRSGTLRGTGNNAGANTLINSAKVSAGALVLNTLSDPVAGMRVRNGTLYQAAFGMQLRYCIDACAYENLQIAQCYNAIYAQFCLYARFDNIMARNTSTGTAYRFSNNCNAITLRNVYAAGTNPGTWTIGFQFDAKTYAVKMLNCSSEYCLTGIKTEEMHGLDIDGHYFEQCATYGINLQSSAFRKIGVRVASCFFSNVPHLVYGRTVNNFVWEATNERFSNNTPGDIDLQTDTTVSPEANSTCTGVIRLNQIDQQFVTPNASAVIFPAWLLLSDTIETQIVADALVSGSGFTTAAHAKSIVAPRLNPAAMSGYYGTSLTAADHLTPFLTATIPTGASVTATIDTQLAYHDYGMWIFRIDLTDSASTTYKISGRVVGADVFIDINPSAKTVTASNQAGALRLSIAAVVNNGGTAVITAAVRHI